MHKCLKCGAKFERITGSMLSGCPECGGKFFLYVKGDLCRDDISTGISTDISSDIGELVDRIEIDDREPLPLPLEEERIESLRVLSPGVYELNLNTLLERNEIIMQIKENGTYVIPLPSLFRSKKRKKRKER